VRNYSARLRHGQRCAKLRFTHRKTLLGTLREAKMRKGALVGEVAGETAQTLLARLATRWSKSFLREATAPARPEGNCHGRVRR
jgi:hypothetical protein